MRRLRPKNGLGQFVTTVSCPECGGARLNKEALHYRIDGKNIAELTGMDIAELYQWLDGIEDRLPEKRRDSPGDS